MNAYNIGNLQSIFSVPGFFGYLFKSAIYNVGGKFKYYVYGYTSISNVIISKFVPGNTNLGAVNVAAYLSPFIYLSFYFIYINY